MKTVLVVIPFFILACAHKPYTTLTTTSRSTDKTENPIMDRDAVRLVMRQSLPDFKRCYETTLKNQSEYPNGKINLTWQIHENGIVHYAHINEDASTLRDQNLEFCLLGVLQKIRMPLPPPGTIAEVTGYPFVFEGKLVQK